MNLADMCVNSVGCHHFTGKQGEIIVVVLFLIVFPILIGWIRSWFK